MFGFLFGCGKDSKCKKLVQTVQCRLKLLKNKRLCVVNQLRNDVSELLKHGHHYTAFERVEQVIIEESIVQVYDLLDQYCEFILLFNIRSILKHRDCPNNDNIIEAISSLIFSSTRIRELPELLSIRKLFGKRYGKKFVTSAIELLPGNLVNNQIKEKLCSKNVFDDVKYKLLDEIAATLVPPAGQLLLEYKPEIQQDEEETKETDQSELYIERETEEKIVYTDSDSYTKMPKESSLALETELIPSNPIQDSDPRTESLALSEYCNFTVSHPNYESSSETSAESPKQIVFVDDEIEEIVSPHGSKDVNLQDKRLFMFKSVGKTDYVIECTNIEEQNLFQENLISKSPARKKKASTRKTRTKRRLLLCREDQNIADVECATYYGESEKRSTAHKRRLSKGNWRIDRATSVEGDEYAR
ncbi:hypothetical protein ACP275_08G109200 [Erythranthe tilingii]